MTLHEGSTARWSKQPKLDLSHQPIALSSQPNFDQPSIEFTLDNLFADVVESAVNFNSVIFNDLGYCKTDRVSDLVEQ